MLTLGINNKPKLSHETFCQLRDIIYSKCGIFFADTKKYLLETRLSRRIEEKNLKSFEDYYYYYLTYDRERESEMTNVLNSIVTNETSFFRDMPQLEAFQKGVVPQVIEAKSKAASARTLKVWSAASSTGEEPYTLAMMLMESGLPARGWTLDILGTDLSDLVLKSAGAGVYEKYSLRNTPELYLKKYFTGNGDSYAVQKKVQEIVKFRKLNLVDSLETRMVKGMDIIFCRNVLIYFDDASKKKAVSHLYDSLNSGGYLFVGFSETLHNITRLFRPVSIERLVVYQKV